MHQKLPNEALANLGRPTAENTVVEIKAYLDSEGISYPSNAVKADLLALVEGGE
ncbi:HeH/LEM domain-containing protein [Enterococcus dispar]